MSAIFSWFSQHTLALFAVLIFVAIFFWLMRFQKTLNLFWKEAALISLVHVIVGWSCMRLMAYVEVGFEFEKAANIRLYGAIFTLPFAYYFWAKKTNRNPTLVMDVAAICVIFGAISGRFNCLTNGCCQGYPLYFPGWEIGWPLRELELLYYFLFIGYFAGKIQKGKTYGQVYPIYLLSYGVLRFFSEFLREEYTGTIGKLHLAHIWSLIAIVVGAVMYYKVKHKYKPGKVCRNNAKNNS